MRMKESVLMMMKMKPAMQKGSKGYLEDGNQLEKIAGFFDKDHPLETSVDAVFSLDQVNEALDKVKRGGSKGKTIIKVHDA